MRSWADAYVGRQSPPDILDTPADRLKKWCEAKGWKVSDRMPEGPYRLDIHQGVIGGDSGLGPKKGRYVPGYVDL